MKASGTESKEQDTCCRSGNNAHADDVDIRPIYDEAPMTEGFKEFSTGEQVIISDNNSLELEIHDHSNEPFSSKLVPKVVTLADSYIMTRVGITIPPSHNNAEGIIPTKIELTLEQSQQGVINDILVSIEGVEELKRNVWIKGENKAALYYTLGRNWVNTYAIRFTKINSGIEDKTSWT
uniref:Uncharacterized protein n=1 Tax=Tanacetum cinerariifolium TaxID=118510 RepID=A0A699GVW0_TANCI|nr:hypothetical protein [Tanacetum cinerariifolium]